MQKRIVLRKNPEMATRVIDGEAILMPIYKTSEEINCIYTLNKTASQVWEMVDGKRTLAQIKKRILQEFDANEEEVDKKVVGLLADLKEIKAIV
jgi:hypothetical protein